MMQVQEEHVVYKDHMQIIKGKRTKRQRLAMVESSSDNSNSGGFDHATTSNEFRNTTEEEDQDMANCLILLAQGHHHAQKASHSQHVAAAAPDHDNNNNSSSNNKAALYLYQCKTCNRCFPSFQALGGHRASHKKPKANSAQEKQAVTTTFVTEGDNNNDHYYDPTSTALTLQISNRALYSSTITTTTAANKSKVHECSICGAEFTSGQALGGHMRRHRSFLSTSTTTTTTTSMSVANNIGGGGESPESLEAKRPRNALKLDLNLPAPEDDHRESKLPFQSKEKVIIFSASSLVDCHY